jgi:hypothetical protein
VTGQKVIENHETEVTGEWLPDLLAILVVGVQVEVHRRVQVNVHT